MRLAYEAPSTVLSECSAHCRHLYYYSKIIDRGSSVKYRSQAFEDLAPLGR